MSTLDELDLARSYEHLIDGTTVSQVRELLLAVPRRDLNDERLERWSILSIAGLGKEIWQGVDVQAYVDELRDDWDAR